MIDQNLRAIIEIAEEAGKEIIAVYRERDLGIELKADVSPITRADRVAHQLIVKRLKDLEQGFPVLSEESREVLYQERQSWDTYWLVDPLDGTKEFIKRNDEFTVNIALIENGRAGLGVVHAPALGLTYYAVQGRGAFRVKAGGKPERIQVGDYREGRLKIAASRSHAGEALKEFLGKINNYERVSMGSSLKFCLIADGTAHLYIRFGRTMEWDTAAAQCVVEEAGGVVTDLSGTPLRYNKPDLSNPEFVATGSPPFPWRRYLSQKMEEKPA